MARIAFIADVHLANHRKVGGEYIGGINQRGSEIIKTLQALTSVLQTNNVDAVVVCGDLFDTDTPSPPLIAATMGVVQQWMAVVGQVILLVGNHDQRSDQCMDHALAPLIYLNRGVETRVHVVDSPRHVRVRDVCVACVPFAKGSAAEWFSEAVRVATAGTGNTQMLLAFHLGVEDENTPVFLRGASDSVAVGVLVDLCESYGIGAAFAGNWHTPRRWSASDVDVVQCGAFVPTGWDNPGLAYGFVTLYDTDTGSVAIQSVPGPRFVVVNGVPKSADKPQLSCTYVRVRVPSTKDATEALAWIEANTRGHGEVLVVPQVDVGGDGAVPSPPVGVSQVREVVHRYIEGMPLVEGVRRGVIHQHVMGALG